MKRTLLILCALLAMAYSAGTQAQNVWDGTVAGSFAGGNGTAEDPYLIADGAQLARFASMVNSGQRSINGKLTADIELNDTTNWTSWNESTAPANSWTPIGSDANPFKGTLDGDGHSVSGIYVNSNEHYQGFVGYLGVNGIIQNIGVKESYVKGVFSTGGVCGQNDGLMINCYNSGNVTGSYYVGGVCGRSTGTNNEYSFLTNCYNTGKVTGHESVGGVCGLNTSHGPISNCYNIGSVTGSFKFGSVCGHNDHTVTNCYYLEGTTDGIGIDFSDSGKVFAKSAEQFASGEVAYLLGEGWGQTIGTDEYPVLGGEKVYQYSDGTYGNTPLQAGEDGFYLISTADELRLFAAIVNGTLTDGTQQNTAANGRLTADILLNDTTNWTSWNETNAPANSWTPIGSGSQPFSGTLDGDGHSVSGIYVNNTANYQGLVGYLGEGGTLQNLGVKASYIKGVNRVGGLCGRNNGTVTNCYNTGSVEGNNYVGGVCGENSGPVTNCYNTGSVEGNNYVGGLCGMNYGGTVSNCYNTGKVIGTTEAIGGVCGWNDGTVTNCYNTGSVEGNNYVGGVCGDNYDGTVSNCYNTGSVEGNRYVGGVCGWNSGTVTNCYNTGNVTGSDFVGGLCGRNNATVTNCYNTGSVEGNYSVGGLCGMNEFGTVTNCYNAGNVAGNSSVGGVCGYNNFGTVTNCYYLTGTTAGGIGEDYNSGEATEKTAEQFQSGEVAWLLQNEQEGQVWGQTIGTDEYPVLGGEKVLQIGNGYVNELKQEGDFYLISTADELRLFAAIVNGTDGMTRNTAACGKLTADILLNDTTNWKNWETTAPANSWTPIGSGSQPFSGTLDGDGHSVSGIYINSTEIYQGLVGYLGSGGTLQNLGVKASYIKGGYSVGGVCGRNDGTVTNCYNTGNVTGNSTVGGVCGENYFGTVTNCYNTGSVTGSNDVGGVCGYNNRTVTNCYNTGSVEGTERVGGVCGYNYGATVTNCYNTGSVTGSNDVGGLCGRNDGTVNNCYNTGSVTGSNDVGGLCGQNYATVTNCYYLNTCGAAGEGTSKTADEFASGEVAWLLQGEQEGQVWGQTIGTDNSPVWQTEGNKVYKLTLQNVEEANALYANSGNFTLPAPAEREGYTFVGWFTAQADGTQMQNNAELTEDKTLYAQWTANSYTVTFEANGGEGSMNQQTFTYDVAQALNQNTFTRTGYSFTGWNTQADGSGSTYGDKAEVLNLTTEAGVNITLYAQWTANTYIITFVDEDGITILQSSEVKYGQTPEYNGETPTKESTAEFDYTFAGWTPQIANVTEEATYKATYTATKRSYTLTVALAEGCEEMGEVSGSGSYEYGTVVTLTAIAHEGYKFMQWSDGDTNATRTIIVEGEVTLTATFEAEGGSETGLEEQMADTFQVIGMERSMRIEGSEQEACVFNTAGQLIYRGTERIIEVHAAGIYLVRIGNETKRVMVR